MDKGKSTLVGLAVLRSGGKCCCEQGVCGISQSKEKQEWCFAADTCLETSFKPLPCPGEGWWLNSSEGPCPGVRHLGCCCWAPEIGSHPTEKFICWKEVEAAFCPAPRGSSKGLVMGSETMHEDSVAALMGFPCCPESITSPNQPPAGPEVSV